MALPLKKILVAYRRYPPILDHLQAAFAAQGIQLIQFSLDDNTWFDKWVINRLNKQLHNLRILPKSKSIFENHPLAHRNYLNRKLWQMYESQQPDAVLMIRDTAFGHEALAKMDCLKFGWWIESENRIHEVIEEVHLFDWYFCMNDRCVDALKNAGYPQTSYLQHAVDTATYHPVSDVKKQYDLCFVGTYSEQRRALIEAALEVTQNIIIYGPRWKEKCRFNRAINKVWSGERIRGAALNQLYNESRVVLNETGWKAGAGHQKSGMNMRCMEVPATGACLLTDEVLELDRYFAVGKDLLVYRDVADFKQKLRDCLENTALAEAVGQHGFETVTKNYTYAQTAQAIVDKYQEIKG